MYSIQFLIFAAYMKKESLHIVTKWLLFALFIGYMGSITLFTHTHVVNHIRYVHSHPFKKSENKQHHHTENQLFLLGHLYKTQLTPNVVCDFDFSDGSTFLLDISTVLYEGDHSVRKRLHTYLRAPPAA